MRPPKSWQVSLILIIGVLSVSTTAILIRLALEASQQFGVKFSLFLAASRLIIASFLLLPAWPNLVKIQVTSSAYYYAIGAGVTLALHFACWITSLSFTSIAASTTLVTTNPVWVAILSWLWLKEKPTKLTSLGIIIALGGSILIALGDSKGIAPGSNPILGNILALMGAWMVSLYLILGKEAQHQGLTVSSYIVIVYMTAALLLFPLPLIFGYGYTGYSLP
ncbi:MAG: DMT family transporter, partial [Cyanobacteria bacterium P01_G01_bin.49]